MHDAENIREVLSTLFNIHEDFISIEKSEFTQNSFTAVGAGIVSYYARVNDNNGSSTILNGSLYYSPGNESTGYMGKYSYASFNSENYYVEKCFLNNFLADCLGLDLSDPRCGHFTVEGFYPGRKRMRIVYRKSFYSYNMALSVSYESNPDRDRGGVIFNVHAIDVYDIQPMATKYIEITEEIGRLGYRITSSAEDRPNMFYLHRHDFPAFPVCMNRETLDNAFCIGAILDGRQMIEYLQRKLNFV